MNQHDTALEQAQSGPAGKAATVEIADLCMAYKREGDTPLSALDHISARIPPAEFCSIVGPSGCGKSTLLMLTAGLYSPTDGRVLIDGQVVGGPWHNVGIVFQRDVLLDWRTVLDNVLLPIEVKGLKKAQYRERAGALLSLVGLDGFDKSYPDQLSGGMRQRVAICRALIHSPPLLLMDEPFGALDALTRERLNFDLLRLTTMSSQTVLFVTHSIEEAVLMSDQVIVMGPRPGKVLRTCPVKIPKPRTLASRSHPEFHKVVDEIRDVFHTMGVI